ncbi:sugar phosphate isomerase/epimerase [Caballeronia sp. dw_19]|uniref:sugar phosphate isomerase/epimerase family protein n=1 Tax=Caballeronia sp. dw_19 TaxID=2719791 RepID=UPI001BD35F6A|nr:sugar phosphate isomerase/epimerase [Caballeronia sp. dw_19]
MSTANIELLAAYWTIAGDVYPCAPNEISPFSLRERAEAASRAGWNGVGLILPDLKYNVEKFGLSGVKHILEDTGMKYFELEILVDWYRTGDERALSDQHRRDFIELGGALGMRNLKIGASHLDEGPADLPQIADAFARLCEDVAQIDATVSLEFMPFSIVKNLQDGLAIVEGADQPNGGLMLDIWHVARSGCDYSEIAKVPTKYIKGIELDDGDAQVVGTLFEDTRFQRRLCGEGTFDCPAFIDAVWAAGMPVPYYGVELISETFRKLPLDEMAKRAYDTTIAQFSSEAKSKGRAAA